jgi:5-methylcytosine-specific restriction endonuclease McrA
MDSCEICLRSGVPLTRHHLLPQSRHDKPGFLRRFSRGEGQERIAMLCPACHSCVHSVLTEKELERDFNTVDSLRSHPEIAHFARWLGNKPPGYQPLSRRAKR